jgi:hypothetical protein
MKKKSRLQSTDILDDIKKSSFELEQAARNQTHLLDTRKKKQGGWEDQFINFLTSVRASKDAESLWTETKALELRHKITLFTPELRRDIHCGECSHCSLLGYDAV